MASNERQGFGILIVAHGQLATEYLATLQHVIGQQSRVEAVSIVDSDNKEAKRLEIARLVEKLDVGTGVVIATDMFGGTPSNLAMKSTKQENLRVIYGINMPALIKLARLRHKPLNEAVESAVSAGHRYLNYCENRK